MQEETCSAILNKWIVSIKKEAFTQNIQNENPEELMKYKYSLEELESKLRYAIENENNTVLEDLRWPKELMECIKDMEIRAYILDCLQQAFTVHHFNQSPKHEEELNNTKKLI
jgi:hypothetical protein